MITDSIQSCISVIKQKQDVLRNKQSYEDYQKALASLSKECQSLGGSLDTLDSIEKYKISNSPLLNNGIKTELLNAIDQCGEALANGQLSKEAIQVFGSHTKQLQRELTASWKMYAGHYAEGVTGYLGIIQGFTDNPKEVDELRTRIGNLANGDPTPTAAKKLSADVTQANAIISKYSLKPEIEVFLKKVAAKQATVSDLSPEVLNWLSNQKLLEKLKLSF